MTSSLPQTDRTRQRSSAWFTQQHSTEHDMHELNPWPDNNDNDSETRLPFERRPTLHLSKSSKPPPLLPRSPSLDARLAKSGEPNDLYGSLPRSRTRPLFAGPPPPITSSVMMPKTSTADRQHLADRDNTGGQYKTRQESIRSLLFDHEQDARVRSQPDSIWRGIRRREKALEKEAQELLDLQANGLIAGSPGVATPETNLDEHSDTGNSTPTGTFYSSATSKSRMVNSLHMPARSTPEGNVIPVRQPKSSRPQGLRSARTGLRRTMSALAQLKVEESTRIEDALTERRRALNQVNKLILRRESVSAELRILEEDEEEPLGQEMRDLGAKYDSVTQEIRKLEEKLVGMRNQRRWLRGRMEDVKNRREAGLSGYRGALNDVDSEVTAIVTRPPVQPLDLEVMGQEARSVAASAGGMEFLQMIPERRTVEMAKAWWESEIMVLERQRSQADADRQALEDGGAVWAEVTQLVSDYESRLRQLMKVEQSPDKGKGKEKTPSQEVIRQQLPEMHKIIKSLEQHQQVVQERGWNLLICAIGAELEAFTKAQEMLEGLLTNEYGGLKDAEQTNGEGAGDGNRDSHDESSDNEVPADLLVSRAADNVGSTALSVASPQTGLELKRTESADDVPVEFLAEHREKMD